MASNRKICRRLTEHNETTSVAARLNEKRIKHATLPVDTRDRIGDLACICSRIDSSRWQSGRHSLTGGLTRGRGRNGPSNAHVTPTYPILGRMLPRGLRVLRQPTASGASRHYRGSARPGLMTYHVSTVQRRTL